MRYRRPRRLRPGDTVGIVSPSSGSAASFPAIFDHGLLALRETFGLHVKEYPTTRRSSAYLWSHPKERANDLLRALEDPETSAVIASIGGDDSVRLLPLLEGRELPSVPKVLLGYSDTTTLLTWVHRRGWVTFHGPSVMAGFSQTGSLPRAFQAHVRTMLFDPPSAHDYRPYGRYSDGYPDWSLPRNLGKVKRPHLDRGPHQVQGDRRAQGRLFGGCLEVLSMMLGTPFWPGAEFFEGRLLFLETSEEKPTPKQVQYFLRNLGVQGLFDRIEGLLVGRARDYSAKEKAELDRTLRSVVGVEFDRPDLPVVSNLDFGHTDPQWILPLGVRAEIDPKRTLLRLLEPALL